MMYSGYVHKSSLMPSKTGPTWIGLLCELCGCTRPKSNAPCSSHKSFVGQHGHLSGRWANSPTVTLSIPQYRPAIHYRPTFSNDKLHSQRGNSKRIKISCATQQHYRTLIQRAKDHMPTNL